MQVLGRHVVLPPTQKEQPLKLRIHVHAVHHLVVTVDPHILVTDLLPFHAIVYKHLVEHVVRTMLLLEQVHTIELVYPTTQEIVYKHLLVISQEIM
jgi:hypothetical protein